MFNKKPITIIASQETYQNLSTFTDIESLNQTVRYYKETYKLNKNHINVLNLLHRYSAKYRGVSFLTKNNIANQLNISKRTVIRVCQHLQSINILKQYEMKRQSDMQQTSNAIVIQPIQGEDVTQDNTKNSKKCHSKKTNSYSLKQNHNARNERQLDHTYVSSNVPQKLVQAISPFFDKAEDIYSIYRRLTLATQSYTDSLVTNLDDYIKTFKETIHKYKYGNIKGDYLGYLYGAFKRTCEQLHMRQMAVSGVYYDWLSVF